MSAYSPSPSAPDPASISSVAASPSLNSNSNDATNQNNPHASQREDGGQLAAAASREKERRRLVLRANNLDTWRSGPSPPRGALDSNLKKNTAFIKKVKQGLGHDSREQLLKELGTLNLDKYLEEIVQAVPEGLTKCITNKDCSAAVEVLSAFHARFGGLAFSGPLTHLLSSALSPSNRAVLQALPQDQRDRDEAARVARQKGFLRISAELALVEVVGRSSCPSGPEWLYQILRELVATDKEHLNVPMILNLLKTMGTSLIERSDKEEAGDAKKSQSLSQAVESLTLKDAVGEALSKVDAEDGVLVPVELRQRFRKLLETYFTTLSRRIVKEHNRLQEQDKRNHEAYIRLGEIFEDRQQSYEKMTRSFERVFELGKALSEHLSLPMPVLTDFTKSSGLGLGVNLDSKSAFSNDRLDDELSLNKSPFEDEDSKKFYQDLVDLKDMVPTIFLLAGQTQGSKPGEVTAAEVKDEALDAEDPATSTAETLSKSPSLDKDTDAKADEIGAGPGAQLNALLARLPEMTNRTMIDSAAVEFSFLNSRAARKRLVKHLGAIPRSRSDLIPYYARLVATLNQYMPDVGEGIVGILDDEFRYLQRKRTADLAETRAKNARFLSELTKFGVTPSHIIFHCLKVCLDDFSGPNIENVATFLESCGRFLLRSEDSADRMRSMLEMLRRKRAAQNLDQRQLLLLDNAYYQCNPPERKAIELKNRSPMELFIRHLIYDVLTKRSSDKVLKLLRKLHWEDPEVVGILRKIFTRPWKIKFSTIHLLAILLHDLQAYHSDFTVSAIDQVFENIRTGMENNIFKHNQRRVATVKYLGELYNYRLINSSIVFDQLWSFTTFGHPEGRPLPNRVSSLDAPDDYFRIRLVCTLLDTCGMCFDRGSLKKRLDDFLTFFNLYVVCKEQPLPMDIDFMLSETLETLRPKLVFKQTFDEAALLVDEMMAAHRVAAPAEEEEEEEGEEESDEEGSGDESDRPRVARSALDDDLSGSEAGHSDEALHSGVENGHARIDDDDVDLDDDESEGEDETFMSRRREEETGISKEEDDEFARELAKMMAETGPGSGSGANQARSQRGLFDAGIPFIRRNPTQQQDGASEEESESDAKHMKFSLLSKKGNKHMTHDVQVPADAAIAINTRSKQLRDLAERQQLKELVLSYEGREEVNERKSLEHALGMRGFKVKNSMSDDRAG
ncbi:ARM repeat-containing protein [Violaceomyces palustris]|uniref:ARM repeat-containing protein n=1 Tax=Violaceomyces palustris TaxID=1673888 RepID=A0ACD0NY53_9BASI|nr:ARM repeat-containing protein [Violaceomyces palustris]